VKIPLWTLYYTHSQSSFDFLIRPNLPLISLKSFIINIFSFLKLKLPETLLNMYNQSKHIMNCIIMMWHSGIHEIRDELSKVSHLDYIIKVFLALLKYIILNLNNIYRLN
jgi:hypothetical protein